VHPSALKAYQKTQMDTLPGRELEAEVLTKAAKFLLACQEDWNASDRRAKLDEALKYNQLIWSVFQSELVKNDNPLPKELRENLLNLSLFIDKRTYEIMAFPAPEKLTMIIDINLNIAAGLRGE